MSARRTTLRRASAILAAATLAWIAGCGGNPAGPSGEDPLVPDPPQAPLDEHWKVDLTGSASRAIWGDSPDRLIVGANSYMTHFTGTDWEARPVPGNRSPYALWGAGDDDVWGLVPGGDILHFDGDAWSLAHHTDSSLQDIWGSSASNIYACGLGGAMVHFDGNAWSSIDTGVTGDLHHIAGSGPSNIYTAYKVVGGNTYLLHFDGAAWTPREIHSASSAEALAVHTSGNTYTVDSQGWLYRGSSGSLSDFLLLDRSATSLATRDAFDLFGVGTDGSTFRWWNGALSWQSHAARVLGVWAAPWGSVYSVGAGGQIVVHDGSDWRVMREGRSAWQFNSLFGSPDGAIFACGIDCARFDGTEWTGVASAAVRADRAGWAVSRDHAVAVGTGGVISEWHGNGWENVSSPVTSHLEGVWMADDTHGVAVGFDGVVLAYDGGAWSSTDPPLDANLHAVHGTSAGDVFACGTVGRLYHFDGSSWSPMTSPTTSILLAVRAVSPGNVYAAGYDGTVIHYDGTSWQAMSSPTTDRIVALQAAGADAMFALTNESEVLRYDGDSWTSYGVMPGGGALELWATPTAVYCAGQAGTVMHREW